MEERLTELEIKMAHQEMTIEQLNQVITVQQQEITEIKHYLEILKTKIELMQQAEKDQPEPPPPHY